MKVYTVEEYCLIKKVSRETIRQRIKQGNMPSDYVIRQLPGKRGKYVIVTPEELSEKK